MLGWVCSPPALPPSSWELGLCVTAWVCVTACICHLREGPLSVAGAASVALLQCWWLFCAFSGGGRGPCGGCRLQLELGAAGFLLPGWRGARGSPRGWLDGEALLSLSQKSHPFCRSCWEIQVWAQPHKNDANPPKAAAAPAALPLLPPLPGSFLGAVPPQHLPCECHQGWGPGARLGLGGISKLSLFQPPSTSPRCPTEFQQVSDSMLGSTCSVPGVGNVHSLDEATFGSLVATEPSILSHSALQGYFPQCSLFNGMRNEEFKLWFPD